MRLNRNELFLMEMIIKNAPENIDGSERNLVAKFHDERMLVRVKNRWMVTGRGLFVMMNSGYRARPDDQVHIVGKQHYKSSGIEGNKHADSRG